MHCGCYKTGINWLLVTYDILVMFIITHTPYIHTCIYIYMHAFTCAHTQSSNTHIYTHVMVTIIFKEYNTTLHYKFPHNKLKELFF